MDQAAIKNQNTSPYAGCSVVLTTKHQKSIALAPPFKKILGAGMLECVVNTDQLCTFSGEIECEGNALDAVRSNSLEAVLPKSAKPGSEYQFPKPAGATWEQFIYEFTEREILLVSCGQVQERLEPEHLKMKNENSGKPTLHWTLLRSLTTTGVSISWQDQDVTDRVKKQKQELANKLKQTFGLSEDPPFLGMKARKHTKQGLLSKPPIMCCASLLVDNDMHRLVRTGQLPSP